MGVRVPTARLRPPRLRTVKANGSLLFSDIDISDESHSASVAAVAVSSGDAGTLSNAQLLALMSTTGVGAQNDGTGGSLGWSFSASGDLFDYLDTGQTLRLEYTVEISDGIATDQETVTITIRGRDEDPALAAEEDGVPVDFALTDLGYTLAGDPTTFTYQIVDQPNEGTASLRS